jgi:hypothetical protein
MAYDGQIIDIFVSSPGDVAAYRDSILAIVQAWNQRNGRNRRLFFNCLRWEDLVSPDIGESGQEVINTQIGDRYDVFLGVMWARFGTPTKFAESGTEEEFDRAILRHQAGEPIKVSFLFCTADVPFSQLDGDQFAKVQAFKCRAQSDGCLTRDFVDDASLINGINLILDKFANTWKYQDPLPQILISDQVNIENNSNKKGNIFPEKYKPDDRGLLDVHEDFAQHNQEFTCTIGEWGNQLDTIVQEMSSVTEKLSELTNFGISSPQIVRPVINGFTVAMENFASWCEDTISDLEMQMELISKDSLMLVELSANVDESVDDIKASQDAMNSLCASIEGANEGVLGFIEALENSPKLDKKLNKANRRVISTHRRLVEKNRIFQQDMLLCASELGERISKLECVE